MPALPYWFWPGDDRPAAEIDDEITEELRLHIDLLAEENVRQGFAPDAAKRQAAERFGDFDTVLRRCRAEKQGDLPMLKRVQTVLTLLLLIGVLFLGVRDYVTASTTAQYMDQTTGFLKSIQGDLAEMRRDMATASTRAPSAPDWNDATPQPVVLPNMVGPHGDLVLDDSLEEIGSLKDSENYTLVKKRRVKADLEGYARDAKGKAVANADVLLIVKTWPNNRFRQDDYAVKTDESGIFELPGRIPLDGQYGINAVVVAEGQAIASKYVLVEDPAGQLPKIISFGLRPSAETRLLVTDQDGKPVARALVAPSGSVSEDDVECIVYHQGSNPVWKKTDADGAVTVDWFAKGDIGLVRIRPRGGDWQEKKIDLEKTTDETIRIQVD